MSFEKMMSWVYPLMSIFFIITFAYRIEKLTDWSGIGFLAALMVIIIIVVNIFLAVWIRDEISKKIEEKGETNGTS